MTMRMTCMGIALAGAVATGMTPLAAIPPAQELTTEGLGPVRIGMTLAEAEAVMKQKLTIESSDDLQCFEARRAGEKESNVYYLFEAGRLARISVTGVDVNNSVTSDGVGIGATEQQLRQTFGKIVISPHQYDDEGHYVAVRNSRERGIIFETHKGVVTDIHAGSYPAVGYVEGCL